MNVEELLKVLFSTNKKRKSPIDEAFLEQILSIVILNPLDEDRGRSQDQIRHILLSTEIEQDEDNKN